VAPPQTLFREGPIINRKPVDVYNLPQEPFLSRFTQAIRPPGLAPYVQRMEHGMVLANGTGGMDPYLFLDKKILPLSEQYREDLLDLSFGGFSPFRVELDGKGYFLYFDQDYVHQQSQGTWSARLAETQHARKAAAHLKFHGFSLAGAFLYSGHVRKVTNSNTPGPYKNTQDQFIKASKNGNPLRR